MESRVFHLWLMTSFFGEDNPKAEESEPLFCTMPEECLPGQQDISDRATVPTIKIPQDAGGRASPTAAAYDLVPFSQVANAGNRAGSLGGFRPLARTGFGH